MPSLGRTVVIPREEPDTAGVEVGAPPPGTPMVTGASHQAREGRNMATTTLAGGGGLLVDGSGPQDNIWDGEGFGGGQGGYKDSRETPGSPGPGLVLLEIKRK